MADGYDHFRFVKAETIHFRRFTCTCDGYQCESRTHLLIPPTRCPHEFKAVNWQRVAKR